MLRILQIAETYPPEYGGGAGVYVRDLSRSLAGRGHEVRVLCSTASGAAYAVGADRDGDVSVDRVSLPYLKSADPDGWTLGLRRWRAHERRLGELFAAYLRDWRPDVVQYNASRPFGEQAIFSAADAGLPIVAMFHEAWLICARLMLLRSPDGVPCGGPGPLRCLACLYSHYDGAAVAAAKMPWRVAKLGALPAYRLARRRRARGLVSAGIGYSRFMTRAHAPHLSGPSHYVPLGIDLEGLPSAFPARPRTPLRFGFIGGAQPTKGVDLVLGASRELAERGLPFEVLVWGPGRDEVARAAGELGLGDRVRANGPYGPDDLWHVYGEMDVALMATKVSEPFGRVPLEAAAAGIPTIGPEIGGIAESIRHDVDGLLFEFGSAEALAGAMARVLEERDLYGRLVANLPAVPDTRECGSALEAVYFSVLDQYASTSNTRDKDALERTAR